MSLADVEVKDRAWLESVKGIVAEIDWNALQRGYPDGGRFRYTVPNRIVESLKRYANHNVATGSCLRAILEGYLYKAAGLADDELKGKLWNITWAINTYLPEFMWGDKETVAAWVKLDDGS